MKSFIAFLTCVLTVGTVAAATDHSALKKELNVMVSVFQTAFQQNKWKSPVGIRQISSTYLADQGAVFTLTTNGYRHGFLINLDGITDLIPEAPLPPITMVTDEGDFSFEFDTDWGDFAEDAAQQVRDALRQSSEQLRELRQQERDFAWEQRELEREVRNLQFQLRSGPDEDKERQEELKQYERDIVALKGKKAEVQALAEKLEIEQKQKQAEREQAKEKAYRQFLADFEANLGDTLCRFGSGLRALPKGENVTFVLRNIAGNQLDRIYVFDQRNIIGCVQTKIDAEELLAKANIYEF